VLGEAGTRQGGREATFCRDRTALAERLRGRSDLVQEYLPGVEYSVDVLADLGGRPLVAVPRERLRVQEGLSVRGRVLHDPEIERLCLDLAAELGVKGPVCMQLKRDVAGRPRFLELNPRMGGGTLFSAFAGVNLAACSVDLAAGRRLPPLRFAEVTIVRYFDELVWDVARARQRASHPARAAAPSAR
jgi:carbamoyl-phosphate synthase large subunit